MGELGAIRSLLTFIKDRALPSAPTADSIADLLRALEKRAISGPAANSIGARLDAAITSRAARPAAATYFASTDVAWAASAVVLDSGPLAADEYEILAFAWHGGALNGSELVFQHRNALNNGNIIAFGFHNQGSNPSFSWFRIPRRTLVLNERVRLIETAALDAILRVGVFLFVRPV